MKIHIFSLFPEFFESPLKVGLLGKARKKNQMEFDFIDLKAFGKKGRIDDTPFGGGDGMILAYPPLKKALESVKDPGFKVLLSPQGRKWDFKMAKEFSQKPNLSLFCGRYGGVDARFVREFVDEEISIGDYILNGGEAGALVMIESLSRFLDGFLGNEISSQKDSFEEDLLEGPSFTKPQEIGGLRVPQVLLSGDHSKIKEFRLHVSLLLTQLKRPDLLNKRPDLLAKLPEARKNLLKLEEEELLSLGFIKRENQILTKT